MEKLLFIESSWSKSMLRKELQLKNDRQSWIIEKDQELK